jgi:hypothetical protein
MDKLTYDVIEQDGGWTYKVGGVAGRTFPTREAALLAAEQVADEERDPAASQDDLVRGKDGHFRKE